MKRILSETLDQPLSLSGQGPVFLAIGMFDGVHIGHQTVLKSCIHAARTHKGRAGVLTFFPHPSRLFHPDCPVLLIQTPELKEICLRRLGLDFLIEQKFQREFSEIRAKDFPRLLKQVIPDLRTVYVGKNWRFGKGREGDAVMLADWFGTMGVSVVSLERIEYNGIPVSSTRIRDLLAKGDMEDVNELLGYPYFSQGVVVEGKRLGRTLGFPTLNLPWSPEQQPRLGVYQVHVTDKQSGFTWQGIANYGVRPTVEEEKGAPLLEIHLFTGNSGDESLPGPGSELLVEWLRFVRPEKRYASVEELKDQIGRDVAVVRSWNNG